MHFNQTGGQRGEEVGRRVGGRRKSHYCLQAYYSESKKLLSANALGEQQL